MFPLPKELMMRWSFWNLPVKPLYLYGLYLGVSARGVRTAFHLRKGSSSVSFLVVSVEGPGAHTREHKRIKGWRWGWLKCRSPGF